MGSRGDEEEEKIRQFLEIVGESGSQARQFLEATGWQLEEALQLYFAGGIDAGGGGSSVSPPVSLPSASESEPVPLLAPSNVPPARVESPTDLEDDAYVPPPLPVKRDMLYEDIYHYRAHQLAHAPAPSTSVDAFRNFEDEANQRGTNWVGMEGSNSSSTPTGTKDSLAALYRPPFVLMFQGTFEQAKTEAAKQGKWLLVNLQSTKEFSSYTLNRDTWSHEALKETVSMSFVFWQVYDDTEEGRKVRTYYKLANMPTTMVLDPLTGQKMRAWEGMISPDRLLEDLVPYLDRSPMERHPPAILPQKRPCETTRRETPKEVDKSSRVEDEELRRALAASLEDHHRPSVPSDGKVSSKQPSKVEEKSEQSPKQILEPPAPKQLRRFPALPEEPANSSSSFRVAVRFPDGRRAQRRFLHADPIQYLWSFSCAHVPEAAEGRLFRLTQAIPGATALDFNSTDSLQAAGLGNSMIVMTWE